MHVRPLLHCNRALFFGAAAVFVAACGETPQLPTDSDPTVAEVQPADGDFAAALVVHDRHTPDLMDIEGVVGTGLAVEGNRPVIRVYTVHGNVRGIPAHVDQVPVRRVVTGLIRAGGVYDPNNPTTRERPAPNGFSVGHPDITAGTLGAIVRDASNACFALSNNHVLANSNDASTGDSALQPGPFDGGSDPADAIGTLADFEVITFDGSNNTIDAAIAALNSTAEVTGSTPDFAYGAPGTSTVNASVGMSVMKFGRTTGFTTGTVEETNVTVDVCYQTRGPFNCVSLARFVDQISISDGNFSDGGDSGSLIVRSSDASPVGLLFAGSDTRTIANPIDDVLGAFGVSIEPNLANCGDGGGDPPPDENQSPTADFSFTTDGLTATFADQSSDDGTLASWSWDFGDGSGSTAQNPTHTYGASDTYTVTLTVTDNDGATDSVSKDVTVSAGGDDPPADDFTLSASGFKVRGVQHADLTWSGATSTNVDVYRDGSFRTTTPNNGAYIENIGVRGPGNYVYQVCEEGSTSTCSNEASVVF